MPAGLSGNAVALLIVALLACIVLKVSKKIIGFLLLAIAVFAAMYWLVPMVM